MRTSPDNRRQRLWVVSEIYYPEETGTGYYLTHLAESLAADHDVSVLCGQPTYGMRGRRAPRRETRNGVDIRRCYSTALSKDRLPLRLVNALTIAASLLANALARFRRDDIVLVVTAPPTLPFLIALACRLRGARCVLRVDDTYPETLVAAGMVSADSWLARTMHRLNALLYRSVDRICVLGRDMAASVRAKLGADAGAEDRVVVVPNWADVEDVVPNAAAGARLRGALGLDDAFVVEYAGNIGRVQAIEDLFEAARRVGRIDPSIHFLFIGDGAKKDWLARSVRDARMDNVTILEPRPRSEQTEFLNASDVAIMALVPRMTGVAVPSRTYNIMAAGKPVIAALDAHSEIGLLVREEGLGWVVEPGDVDALAAAVLDARRDETALREMGARGRDCAVREYSMQRVVDQYGGVIESVGGAARTDERSVGVAGGIAGAASAGAGGRVTPAST